MTSAISTVELTKYYGPVVGLEPLTLDVAQGEVFGFLGANVAGKTTTIRMLVDLLRPTSGSASILGFDCRRQAMEARRRVGYLPGEMPIYPELTGRAYLQFLASLGRPPSPARVDALLRRFDVSDLDLSRRMRDYSHGMKRKLGIIQALMTDAPVVILDEPTAGLDPLMIEAFGQTIDELARTGRTAVFLSSHILSEVDRVCHRVGLIRSGRLTAIRSLAELRATAPRRLTVQFAQPVHEPLPLPPDAVVVSREAQRVVVDIQGPIGPLMTSLARFPIVDVDLARLTVEDELLRLFGEAQAC
jgi:beta-exotoxin I transport system ATP-binding protein